MSNSDGLQHHDPRSLIEKLKEIGCDTTLAIAHIIVGGLCSAVLMVVHRALHAIETWAVPGDSKPMLPQFFLWIEWMIIVFSALLFLAFLAVPIVLAWQRVYNLLRRRRQ